MKRNFYKHVKYVYILFILASFLFIPVQGVKATHVMGSDIQFICQGNDVYKIRMVVHRDCNGMQLPASQTVQFTSTEGNCSGSVTLSRTGFKDITPVCGDQCTACQPGCTFQYGMQEHIYEGTVNLSNFNCCNFQFYFSECCRNNAIDNISSPGGSHYRMEAHLNKCVSDCPTTPEYLMDPVAIYCVNQDVIYNHGVTAPEGDSLVFSWVAPRQGSGATGSDVNFLPGFNKDEPINYLGKGFPNGKNLPFPYGFHINPLNGDIMFRPTSAMDAILSVGVKQYRGDTLVSQTQRDLQVAVMNCPSNEAPIMDAKYWHDVCENSGIVIPITLADPDSSWPEPDSVYLRWNDPAELGGAQFQESEGLIYATSIFSWIPPTGSARSQPYQFVAHGKDNACPVPAHVARAVSINVKPQPRATIQKSIKACGTVEFNATLINVSNATVTWSGQGGFQTSGLNVTHQFPKPGKYPYTLTLLSNDCQNTIFDTVVVPDFITVNAGNDHTICEGESVTLNTFVERNVGDVTYQWSIGETTPSVTHAFYSDTSVIVTVEDTMGCINHDTVFIDVIKNPVFTVGPDQRICGGTAVTITSDAPEIYQHQWYNLANNSLFSTNRTIAIGDSGTYMLKVTDTTALSCYGFDTVAVFVNPEVIASANPSTICQREQSVLMASGGNEFTWRDMQGNTLATGPQYIVSPNETTDYVIVAHSTIKGVYCEDIDTVRVNVNPLPEIQTPQLGEVCENSGNKYIGGSVPAAHNIFGPGVTGLNFAANSVGPGTYWIKYDFTIQSTGCYGVDSSYIIVNPLPVVTAMPDAQVCQGDGVVMLSGSPNGGVWTGNGVQTNGQNYWFDPEKASPTTHTLTYTFTNNKGCVNSDQMKITTFLSPSVEAGSYGPLCIDDNRIELSASVSGPTGSGSWSGPGVVDVKFFDPKVAGVGSHELTYSFSTNQGCNMSSSTTIIVNNIPQVTASLDGNIDRICETEDPVALLSTPVGANATWSGSPGINHVNRTFDPAAAGPGQHDLTFTYVNQHGCDNAVTISVYVEAAPQLKIFSDSPLLCSDQEEDRLFRANAVYSNANSIEWKVQGDGQISSVSSSNIEYVPGAQDRLNSTFTLSVSTISVPGQVCAVAKDMVVVEMYPRPETAFTIDPPEGCEPHEVFFHDRSTISEGEVTEWAWSFGDGNTSTLRNPVHVYENHGVYQVRLRTRSSEGCFGDYVTQQVRVNPRPQVNFIADPILTTILTPTIKFENRTQQETPNTAYTWNFGDHEVLSGGISHEKHPVYLYSDTGYYTVKLQAINEFGCDDYMLKENYVMIKPDVTVFVPSAFSPNEVGPFENRTFYAVVRDIVDYELHVFTRWGQMVFSSDHPDNHWDGTFNGEHAPEGVYVYQLRVVGHDGVTYKFSGTVTLLR